MLAPAVGHSGRYTVLVANKTKSKDLKHTCYTIIWLTNFSLKHPTIKVPIGHCAKMENFPLQWSIQLPQFWQKPNFAGLDDISFLNYFLRFRSAICFHLLHFLSIETWNKSTYSSPCFSFSKQSFYYNTLSQVKCRNIIALICSRDNLLYHSLNSSNVKT